MTAWLVRRLEELLGWVVGVGLGIFFLVFFPVLLRGLVLASPRIDSVPPFGGDPTAAVATRESSPAVRILPFQRQVRRAVMGGSWPLWNPLHGTGTPLLAAPEAQVAQPFALVAWLLSPGPGLAVTAALQLFVALLFGWLALRRLHPFGHRPGEGSALAGASVYAVLAVLPVHGWSHAHVAALFPVRARSTPRRLRSWDRVPGEAPIRSARSLCTEALEWVDRLETGEPLYLQLDLMEVYEHAFPQTRRPEIREMFREHPEAGYLQAVRQISRDVSAFVFETEFHGVDKIGVADDEWKLILSDDDQAGSAPLELQPNAGPENGIYTDRAKDHPERARRLRMELRRWEQAHPRAPSEQPKEGGPRPRSGSS